MRLTAIRPHTERKRLDSSVRLAEKRGRRASATRVHGLDRPNPGVSASPDTTRGKKTCSAGRFKQPLRQAAGHLGNVGEEQVPAELCPFSVHLWCVRERCEFGG